MSRHAQLTDAEKNEIARLLEPDKPLPETVGFLLVDNKLKLVDSIVIELNIVAFDFRDGMLATHQGNE